VELYEGIAVLLMTSLVEDDIDHVHLYRDVEWESKCWTVFERLQV
jgi:hypothetical protein